MTGDEGETFTLMAHTWDVTRGWELAGDREPVEVETRQLVSLLTLIRIDEEHAMTVDVTRPLLLATYPAQDGQPALHLPIDGWHRLARAVMEQVPTMRAVVLTEAESEQVRSARQRR